VGSIIVSISVKLNTHRVRRTKNKSTRVTIFKNSPRYCRWKKPLESPRARGLKKASTYLNSGSQSDSSDATSTIKRWNSRWTPSEGYDSSDTSTNSDVGDEYVEDYPQDIRADLSEPAIACRAAYRSQECLCQVDLK